MDLSKTLAANATVAVTESNDAGDTPGVTTTKVTAERSASTSSDTSKTATATAAKYTLTTMVLSVKPKSITPSGSTVVDGAVSAESGDGSTVNLTNKDVTIHTTLSSGTKVNDFTLNGSSDGTNDSGFFHQTLLGSQLVAGKNTVTMYATDTSGNTSPTVTATITVIGSVSLATVSKSMVFASTEVPTNETLVKPTSSWDVEVQDDRATGQNWFVYATASKMQSSSHELKGNTVYIDSSGTKHVMTDQSTLMGSGQSTGTATTTKVTKDWSDKQGIFLDVQPGVYAGSYSGTIDWSLQDTPKS